MSPPSPKAADLGGGSRVSAGGADGLAGDRHLRGRSARSANPDHRRRIGRLDLLCPDRERPGRRGLGDVRQRLEDCGLCRARGRGGFRYDAPMATTGHAATAAKACMPWSTPSAAGAGAGARSARAGRRAHDYGDTGGDEATIPVAELYWHGARWSARRWAARGSSEGSASTSRSSPGARHRLRASAGGHRRRRRPPHGADASASSCCASADPPRGITLPGFRFPSTGV